MHSSSRKTALFLALLVGVVRDGGQQLDELAHILRRGQAVPGEQHQGVRVCHEGEGTTARGKENTTHKVTSFSLCALHSVRISSSSSSFSSVQSSESKILFTLLSW